MPNSPDWIDYVKTLLILLGICAPVLIAVRIMGAKARSAGNPAGSILQVIGRYSLEPRKTIYVVRAGKKTLLLSAAGDSIHYLTALGPEDLDENVLAAQAFARPSIFTWFRKHSTENP